MRYIFFTLTFFHGFLFSDDFLLYDLNARAWLVEQGPDLDERFSPCSTFKIPLSAMGYDAGILQDTSSPVWPFEEGYIDFLPQWRQPHSPALWMRNSCVWFSQVLTTQLGMEMFQEYVDRFDYGNKDLSGGLTRAWLSSSIKISPREQVFFLEKLVLGALPVSPHAISMTKLIMFLDDLNGWKLFGKTGSGKRSNENPELQNGWFVGWLEKGYQTVLFAYFLRDEEKQEGYAGPRAKVKALERLEAFTRQRADQTPSHPPAPENRA